jgi:hypothetical protein
MIFTDLIWGLMAGFIGARERSPAKLMIGPEGTQLVPVLPTFSDHHPTILISNLC